MKLNIGDYVRNQYGIAKIVDIKNKNGIDILVFDRNICFLVNKETGEIIQDRLFNELPLLKEIDLSKIKSSPNIIDLIEVGDYVNGVYISDKYIDAFQEWVVKRECDDDYYSIAFKNRDIETVVTKEKFEQMKYRVED